MTCRDENAESYTDEDLAWFDLMEQIDRDFEAGMYDEENAA